MNSCAFIAVAVALAGAVTVQGETAYERFRDGDYAAGRLTFQGRCSACHTLAADSADIAGPNLWGMFGRAAGAKPGFEFSAALRDADIRWTPEELETWLAEPDEFLPGNIMRIPEPVPRSARFDLLTFMLIETGAVDWPRPEISAAAVDRTAPPSERFPSFWNHLMFNTTRYHWEDGDEDFRFDAWFRGDGSVLTSDARVDGFWHIDDRDFFCYALKGLPVGVGTMVECFPVAAMAIPRFSEQLWTSNPQGSVRLHGGIAPGRPDWVATGVRPD